MFDVGRQTSWYYESVEEFFHVLNRGVDKRKVFMTNADRARFVHDLWEFNDTHPAKANMRRRTGMFDVGRRTFPRELLVKIHFFCLMSNHYHLLLSPVVENGIPLFMKKLNGGYAKYFNEKYAPRSGALWQGGYKSVRIETDRHFLYIPYYIHFNALDLATPEWREGSIKNTKRALDFLNSYRWSSHLDYLGKKNFPSITDRSFFLESFGGERGYQRTVEKMLSDFSADEVAAIALE